MANTSEDSPILKPSPLTFHYSRLELNSQTPEELRELILRARSQAKDYYIAAVLRIMGLKELNISLAIWGFEPHWDTLTLRQTPFYGQAFPMSETTFIKSELEAL